MNNKEKNQKAQIENSPPQIWRPKASKSKRGGHLTAKSLSVFIKTFGWPMDKLLHSDFTLLERVV